MPTSWNDDELTTEPADVRWAINPRNTFESVVGEVPLLGKDQTEPTTLNLFLGPTRVDIHCHLIQAIQESTLADSQIEYVLARLKNCTVFTDTSGDEYCQARKTKGDNTFAFIRYALSNNALAAVPAVLGAAMRAAQVQVDVYRQPERLERSFAIAVPLSLDLAFMPMQLNDSELIAPFLDHLALVIRALVDQTVTIQTLPSHLESLFPASSGGFHIVVPNEKKLCSSIETMAEIARHSRGSLQPFLAFEPRRWVASVRSTIGKQEQEFQSCSDYLSRYLFGQSEALQASRESPHRGFAGIKVYTRHGWSLSNNAAIYGARLGDEIDREVSEMLTFANKHHLPITNHHSPGGTPPNQFLVPPLEMVRANSTKVPRATASDTIINHQNCGHWLAWIAAAETAFLCEYVERTASPQMWDKHLKTYPNLRVNFAHAGSAASMLAFLAPNTSWVSILKATQNIGIKSDEVQADKDILYLLEHPMAVQEELFAPLFWKAVEVRLAKYRRALEAKKIPSRFVHEVTANFRNSWEQSQNPHAPIAVNEILGHAFKALARLQDSRVWQTWTQSWWKNIQPLRKRKENWFEAICRLCEENVNAYMDFSYATSVRNNIQQGNGGNQQSKTIIATALRYVFAERKLAKKAMFGTDWFLIEQDIGSADDAWELYRDCFVGAALSSQQWDRFAGLNALEFLDLAARKEAIEKFVSATGSSHLKYWPIFEAGQIPSPLNKEESPELEKELRALRKSVDQFSKAFIHDDALRNSYIKKAALNSERIMHAVRGGILTETQAAKVAHELRSKLRGMHQNAQTQLGRSISESIEKNKSLAELQAKYADELFATKDFAKLPHNKQGTVNLTIVEKSGMTRSTVDGLSKNASRFGRGFMIFSVGVAVHNIYTAEDKTKALATEASTSVAAGIGAVVVPAILCGPAAPACVGLSMFVGSFVAAYAIEHAIEWLW